MFLTAGARKLQARGVCQWHHHTGLGPPSHRGRGRRRRRRAGGAPAAARPSHGGGHTGDDQA